VADAAIQRRKLELEVENLRKKNRWELWAQFLPMVIAVVGFSIAIYQFQSQRGDDRRGREIERTARFQNQVRADVDEILRSAHDEHRAGSRMAFLLDDIKAVLKSDVDESHTFANVFPEYERSVTQSLVLLVRDDYDFTKNPRDVDSAFVITSHWNDYSKYLKGEPDKLHYILFEYTKALQGVHEQSPGYFESITLSEDGTKFVPSPRYDKGENGYVLYNRFIAIKDGFLRHLEMLGNGNLSEVEKDVRSNSISLFESKLCNPTIAKNIFGPDFTDEPCEYVSPRVSRRGRR
jgi:hypothetical protein